MNLKSNLNKPLLGIESITLGTVLVSSLIGLVACSLIIAWDLATLLKVVIIFFGMMFIVITSSDIKDEKERTKELRVGVIGLIMVLFVCEIGLFAYSDYDESTSLTVITTDRIVQENKGTREKPKYVDVEYVVITHYNNTDNTRVERYQVLKTNQKMIDFYESVVAVRTYIDYTPFIRYSEELEYTRKK